MNKIRNKVIGLGALATALSSGAFASTTSTAPEWASNLSADSFDAILGKVAPIALSIVFPSLSLIV